MYIVEGNIGVGKTTFLSLIKKHCPEIEIVPEPVEAWNKLEFGESLLDNFYKDTSRWAYTLETFTMMRRTKDHIGEQNNSNPNRLFERSIYSGHYCFAKNCYETGHLSALEWNIYNQWADFLIHKQCKPPLGFIYLKASPQICFERVKKRNRPSEKALTLAYIKQIEASHDKFLIEKKDVAPIIKQVPVLTLNCDKDFLDDEANMITHAKKLSMFLAQTQAISTQMRPAQRCL
jgi:deoxyadenosine/deoxycytidine kinase